VCYCFAQRNAEKRKYSYIHSNIEPDFKINGKGSFDYEPYNKPADKRLHQFWIAATKRNAVCFDIPFNNSKLADSRHEGILAHHL
jgi:hypothetical protein